MNSAHRIETLAWEARFLRAAQAKAQQERLASFLRREAMAGLQQGFDAASPPGEVICLERLVVDLGRLRLSDSPAQWRRQLDAALQRSLSAALRGQHSGDASLPDDEAEHDELAAPAAQRQSSDSHEVGQFLHYLEHGLLPWGMPLRSARDLAGWLERLARQQGLRLWQALQQLMPPEPVLARLARIAPHHGLQALLATRHRELADGLLLLDEAWLAPLQRRGRLSAYQVQRLQQQLRVAGLHALWGLSGGDLGGARARRLLASLQAAHADLLGMGWTSLRRALQGQVLPRQPGSDLAAAMLAALLGEAPLHPGPALPAPESPRDPEALPPRLLEQALQRLRRQLLEHAAGRSLPAERLRQDFLLLRRLAPQQLGQALLQQLQGRRARRGWSELLVDDDPWLLLSLVQEARRAPTGAPQPARERPAPPQWADSLRQTALRLLSECPASQRPGLSAMQALLIEASLAHLLREGRLPATHSAWLALWHGAFAAWRGPAAERSAARDFASSTPAQPAAPAAELASDEPARLRQTLLQSLRGLPARIARWRPWTGRSEGSKACAATHPGEPLPAWPDAQLRAWLWREAELWWSEGRPSSATAMSAGTASHAAPPARTQQAESAEGLLASLESHWRRRWQALLQSIEADDEPGAASPDGDRTASPTPALPVQGRREPPSQPASAASPASSEPASPAVPLALDGQDGLDGLRALHRQWQWGVWGPAQRWRLAEALETPQACAAWLALCRPAQRWPWLQAQLGAARAHTLEQSWTQTSALDEARWQDLCEAVFVHGLHDRAPDGPSTSTDRSAPGIAAESLQRSDPRSISRSAPRGPAQASITVSSTARSGEAIELQDTKPAIASPSVARRPPSLTSRQRAAPIWVDDAGQVLLAAYAERLFKHMKLLQDGRFVDAAAQARAVLCLQTLVRGDLPLIEPLCPLSKLLCGLAPDALLADCEPLASSELQVLEELLKAVIAHWKAIGSTSVLGLRESFLQRDGRLQRQDKSEGDLPVWRLKVEARAFDMLLDRLPWGFGLIRLPWMQGVLHVDWR